MAEMSEIEMLTQHYSAARVALADKVETINQELAAVKRRYLKTLRGLSDKALSARADLSAAIDASRDLFVKPRTRVLHGVKIGFAKNKGRFETDDEARTIKLIRRHMNAETAALLVKVTEKLNKAALDELDAADLKRIGVRVAGGGDELVIKAVDGDVDRLVDALLEGADVETTGENEGKKHG